jgi:type I restriction enzyme, S subunit
MSLSEFNKISLNDGFYKSKVKYLVDKSKYYQIGDGDHGSIKPTDYTDSGVPYIRVQNLSFTGKFLKKGLVYISNEIHKKNQKSKIIPYDLLVAKTGSVGKLCLMLSDMPESNTTSSVGKITFDQNKFFPKYFLYYFQSNYMQNLIKQISFQKSAQPGFNIDDLVDFPVIHPNLDMQKQVSRYLDLKTNHLDTLIQNIQKKIQLIDERRKSFINQFTTKGLDLNVEMKESGIKWMGKIPKQWKLIRLAFLGKFSKGKNITKNDLVESGKPAILYTHLYTTYNRVTNKPVFFISIDRSIETTKISKNTFLFTSSGETVDEIGKTLLYSGNEEISIGGDLVIFNFNTSKNFYPEYFSFLFNSEYFQCQKSSMSRGQIIIHIYEKQIREISVAIPPKNDQIEIARRLKIIDENTTRLNKLLNKKIEILNELRQSLISSVVTGKIRITDNII